MDKQRLQELAGVVTERISDSVQGFAEQIYNLAEQRVAHNAASQHGHGFDRNAIHGEVDTIIVEIKAHIAHKLKHDKF